MKEENKNEMTSIQDDFSAELFNLSEEHEDIDFVIDELNGTAQMSVVSRRC